MELEEKFNEIRHFTEDEFDHPDKIDDDALWLLDEMRHREGEIRKIKIRIHADYAISGHSTKSRHAFGDAFDFSIIDAETDESLPILTQFSIVASNSFLSAL